MKRFLYGLAIFVITGLTAFAAFTDVPSTHENYEAITWLEENGVINGYEDGTFKPDNIVNRAEFLKMMYELKGFSEVSANLPFSDVAAGTWFEPYVKRAYVEGTVVGYSDGTFKPGEYINFAEALKIVTSAFLDVDDRLNVNYEACVANFEVSLDDVWYKDYFKVADGLCLLPIDVRPGDYVTRSKMAEMLYRVKVVVDNDLKVYEENLKPGVASDDLFFTIDELKDGMKLGGFTVNDFGPYTADFGPIADNNVKVEFDGEAELDGTYFTSDTFGAFCFAPADQDELPKLENDEKVRSVCFLDGGSSVEGLFEGSEGSATVRFRNFVYVNYPSEVTSTALLLEVEE